MSTRSQTTALDGFGTWRTRADAELHVAFDVHDPSVAALRDAIEYSLHAGGKRVRAVLCMAAADACGANAEHAAPIAAAFELLHAYSLVHDDLPAMDDDDMRRGRPTNHKVHGEAVAILVGDALQARAFELIVLDEHLSSDARVDIVRLLAHAGGWQGMVGGQFLDIDHDRAGATDVAALRDVHDRKTGALIAASVEAGAVAAGADTSARMSFNAFGRALGWLFQLVDDLLDATGDATQLGKTPGKDARSGKVTAVDVFGGVAQLQRAVDEQLERCLTLAGELPAGGGRLPDIARYVHGRDH